MKALTNALDAALGWNDWRYATTAGALPYGAVVATCRLVDVVPIGGPWTFRTGIAEGDEGDYPGRPVVVRHPSFLESPETLVLDHGTVTDITAQLPYGDFTEGRWAWPLADVHALPDPIPARGRQQLFDVDLEVVS